MKLKNLISIFTCFIISILSFLSVLVVLESNNSNTTLSFALDHTVDANVQNEQDNSLYFIDLELVSSDQNYIYIYDKSDNTIKIIDKQTNSFAESANRFKIEGITQMLALDNVLLLYNKDSNTFTCLQKTQGVFSQIEFDYSLITTLDSFDSLQAVKIGASYYLLLTPSDLTSTFEVCKLNYDNQKLSVETSVTFTIDSPSISGYSDAKVFAIEDAESTNMIVSLVSSSNDIISCEVDVTKQVTPYQTVTSFAFTSGQLEQGEDIVSIDWCQVLGNQTICIITNKNIRFYDIEFSDAGINLTHKDQLLINIDSDFDIYNSSVDDATIALISKQNQLVEYYDMSSEQNITQPTTIVNPTLNVEYHTYEDFEYLGISSNTPLLETPYSRTAITTIEEDSNVVVIGYAVDQNLDIVSGWKYCLVTIDNKNYYGFISDLNTYQLSQTTYSKNYITVLAFTRLMSHPSTIVDDVNSVLQTIPSSSRLEVLDSICDYTASSSEYLLVKVNNDQVGFIERSRIIAPGNSTHKIITNAKVVRNNAKIFTGADLERKVIMELNEGHRVQIVGSRDTVTNYTMIKFNDQDGNEITGYIYTYNVQPDSWTMLQIIGIFLISINIVLLAIIIAVKNKATR